MEYYGPAGWTRKLDQGQNGRGERGNEVADGKRTNEHFCMGKKSQIWEVKI